MRFAPIGVRFQMLAVGPDRLGRQPFNARDENDEIINLGKQLTLKTGGRHLSPPALAE